jgi:hypothetical protein
MDEPRKPKRSRVYIVTAAAAIGAAVGAAGIAAAATTGTTSTPTTSSAAAPAPSNGNLPNPATVTHGPGETLLTGTTADKVRQAALAAVPGGTIVRVETDSAGSPYEAHVKKSDGTYVTVKIDSSFKVTAIQSGFGAPPAGAPNGSGYGPPGGQPPMNGTGAPPSA